MTALERRRELELKSQMSLLCYSDQYSLIELIIDQDRNVLKKLCTLRMTGLELCNEKRSRINCHMPKAKQFYYCLALGVGPKFKVFNSGDVIPVESHLINENNSE